MVLMLRYFKYRLEYKPHLHLNLLSGSSILFSIAFATWILASVTCKCNELIIIMMQLLGCHGRLANRPPGRAFPSEVFQANTIARNSSTYIEVFTQKSSFFFFWVFRVLYIELNANFVTAIYGLRLNQTNLLGIFLPLFQNGIGFCNLLTNLLPHSGTQMD